MWKIQNPAGKIWKIPNLAGKIPYLATHHSLTRCSNSPQITHQLAGPSVFFGFGGHCGLRIFRVFSIWFSVFAKNTSSFSVLVPDVVFGFSYFVLFWVPVSVRFEQHLISNSRETPKLFRGIRMRDKINVMVGETTIMAKHGTLPEYLYQRHLEVGDKVNLKFGVDEDEEPHEDLNEHEVREEASVSSEGQQEFDESSDEEVEVSADDNNSQGQQDELGASTNFLFGARSRYVRYGRAVRFNNRLLF